MYALVDCNSFFCSVEKVFHPGLRGKPVCVLSNNDGCIVALTPEAKALGLHRGNPLFKVMDIVKANNVTVFSSNMMLYAAMSKRVTNILRKSIPHVEKYSIDESFCRLDGYERFCDLESFMRDIVEKIRLYTDIPVSVGIAPTKTLAKVGSKYAKKYKGYGSVCVIDNEIKRRKALAMFPLEDIWGIGRRTLVKLRQLGINSPLDLADKSENWMKRHFTIPLVRTWMELNGTDCIDTSEVLQKQSICTSRSFGNMTSDLNDLCEAVSSFAASCANKLRSQHAVAGNVSVFILSNRFREDLKQYNDIQTRPMFVNTSDTIEITHTALQLLNEMYRPGILYKKAGVIVSDISDASCVTPDFFDVIKNRHNRNQLMQAMDRINQRYGTKSICLATESLNNRSWHVKCELKSSNYLTDLNEILTIKI
ncbi:MAG: Y-family DNA polymerase [Prevotella sp.]|nr:Y-family DNA polymerase [Prevotella sp.]